MILRLALTLILLVTAVSASAKAVADDYVVGVPIDDLIPLPDSVVNSAGGLTLAVKPDLPATPAMKPLRTREQNWWLNRLKDRSLNLSDTSVVYPKFVKLIVDVYNWGDRFFNGTDPEYVVGTGKRWKARIVNDNWLDSYAMRLPDKMPVNMLSNPYSNIGGFIQYMAVSLGYTYDMDKIFGTSALNHKKMEVGFNCQRFNVEYYMHENTGGTYLRRFGDYRHGKLIRKRFTGVEMKNTGVDFMYFFNNKRYSHGAAYNFSKFQRRSQGSLIAGFSYTNQKISFDFSQLPEELKPYLTIPEDAYYMFHYDSYALTVGYGYNCVIKPRLLFNITVLPAFGASHCYEDSLEGKKWMFSMGISGRMAFTYNLHNWFFSFIAKMNGNWYKSGTYSLFSSIENFSANIGIRF